MRLCWAVLTDLMPPSLLLLQERLTLAPQMKSVDLDVSSSLVNVSVHGMYELSVTLPEPIDTDATAAKFNKGSGSLTVTMPCSC